jgi:ribonuclease R
VAKPRRKPKHFPTRQQVLDFIRSHEGRAGKREIARAFNLKGPDRIALKEIIRDLEASGDIGRRRRRLGATDTLPEVTVLEIVGADVDGEIVAKPARWTADAPVPVIYVTPDRGGRQALRSGDRILARIKQQGEVYEARVMRRVGVRTTSVLGIFRRTSRGLRIEPTDRRHKSEYGVAGGDDAGATADELVLAEVLPGRKLGLPQARVTERLGAVSSSRAFSLIAIHSHALPDRFPDAALVQAKAARAASLGRRADLRDLRLVTIDGADARDFDDAVWAAPDPSAKNSGGWTVTVAIADVAYYVRPGDALDSAARERGNSVYFPDRVVPMLPAELSNDLCSLRPREDRACLAVHMTIGSDGRLRKHRFERALMRSVARLTYDQVQAARDGKPDETTAPLVEDVLRPLYGAYDALAAARRQRGALEIDRPERQVVLGDDGHVASVDETPRYDSHRLIEEMMIAANVAAAETLEKVGQPCMYRVHDEPDPVKAAALRDFLKGLDLTLAVGQVMQPKHFNRLLAKASGTPHREVVTELVLRCQSQAAYSPHNLGHFGLALRRYAHFTSPIRRYADLLVHRALIRGLGFGRDGLPDGAGEEFERLGADISAYERRAMAAERDTVDRYVAAFLADHEGDTFAGRITGVTRFGLFVRLDALGADGLVPVRLLPPGQYRHDERAHALAARGGPAYRLGDRVEARVVESNPVTGAAIFELLGDGRPEGTRKRRR